MQNTEYRSVPRSRLAAHRLDYPSFKEEAAVETFNGPVADGPITLQVQQLSNVKLKVFTNWII